MAKDKKNDYDKVIKKENCEGANGGIDVNNINFTKPIIITEEKIKEIFSQPVKKGQPLSWGTKNKK